VNDAAAQWMLWGLYAYHAFLLCGLICAALMEYDGQAIGRRLWLPMLFVGWAAPLFWPELRPVPSGWLSSDALAEFPWAAGLVDGLAGLAAGVLAGLATWPAKRGEAKNQIRQPFDVCVAMAWTGLFLGWQAIAVLAPAMAAGRLVVSIAARRWPAVNRLGWICCVAPCVLAWILAWRVIATWLSLAGQAGEFGKFAGALAITAAFSWAIGKLPR
jgi:hypothetical protein